MDSSFATAYKNLNARQKQAVDTTEGAVLVLAGPGTGKTQLLSTRAAHIVKLGNVSANNILCLTYTDAGASEMQTRMTGIMGPSGGDIAVHTFHGFGSWIIAQYPEQFANERALRQLDDLARYRVFELLLSRLPLRHQLAVRGENDSFVRQNAVQNAINAFKQAGMKPAELRQTLNDNQKVFTEIQPLLDEIFGTKLSAKRLPEIRNLIEAYESNNKENTLSAIIISGLKEATTESEIVGKTKPLGDWRTANTTKHEGRQVLKSQTGSKLLTDTIDLYEQYQEHLGEHGFYDYQDMIMWALDALEKNSDMRSDIAERFQYIMVDEYQDTNGAQNRLLDAVLSANPIDMPNVLVVGDDDQAIMRFQGAEVSGMLRFIERYKPVVITLTDNYRSTQPILDAARQIITQTGERLETALPELGIKKVLTSHGPQKGAIEHRSYVSAPAEYAAIADHISGLLKAGVAAEQIAVIGRKHEQLVEFVPHLTAAGIFVRYDNREDILSEPEIDQLLKLSGLLDAIANHPIRVSSLLPAVLSAPYWQLPPLALYQLAATAKATKANWLECMLEDALFAPIAEWLVAAADISRISNFTRMLDILIGREAVPGTALATSPYGRLINRQLPETYTQLLSRLIRLRRAVLESKPSAHGLADLLAVAQDYRRSDIRLIDDSPLVRAESEGVQVMSAHGAKGREFQHVIILSLIDTVWGVKARANHNRIRLPENLPLYAAGDAESDKLRLLYVAITRAKTHLLLTSYQYTAENKPTIPLAFLSLGDEPSGWWQPHEEHLPAGRLIPMLETTWRPQATNQADLKQVLSPLLKNFRLSPSALRDFLDICYSGPEVAIEKDVLGFPSAYSASSALGAAVHDVLERAHKSYKAGKPLTVQQIIDTFDEKLEASGLADGELESVRAHGHEFLPLFVEQFTASDFDDITNSEFYAQATLPGSGVVLLGKLDAAAVQENSIRIIDYKSGKPPLPDWKTAGLSPGKQLSIHFYRQQLLVYKLLIDHSPAFKGKQVDCAELVFVEPDSETGNFIRLKIDNFDKNELEHTEKLIAAVHRRITTLDLPDTSGYSQDVKGVKKFEDDLISGAI
ncbi:MAG: hypothetical protein JWO41_740 [Candidatus Saccharibacteria bacterium]|nr:hypothetical protein [Candidatus Saccharibacteria bacterium]